MNQHAIHFLTTGNRSKTFKILQKGLMFMGKFEPNEDILKLQAMTLNNIGCYYKNMRQPKNALKYLLMANEIEERFDCKEVKRASTTSIFVLYTPNWGNTNKP